MVVTHPCVPLIDVGRGGAVAHAACRTAQALAVRDACLDFLPLGRLLARISDPVVRRWMRRSGSAYVHEIEAIAETVRRPGVWLLPGRFAAAINQAPMRHRTGSPWLLWIDYVLNALGALRRTGHPPPEHVLRMAFDTCRTFDEARQLLETAPVARPVLFMLVGPNAGERIVIERRLDRLRTYSDGTVVANAWCEDVDGWRPRVCGEGTPRENNRCRVATLSGWQGRSGDGFAWAEPPVTNEFTRLTVEMCPGAGTLSVMGWEPDGRGRATPVTRATTFSCRTADLQVRS
jgi:hypothetical protein